MVLGNEKGLGFSLYEFGLYNSMKEQGYCLKMLPDLISRSSGDGDGKECVCIVLSHDLTTIIQLSVP